MATMCSAKSGLGIEDVLESLVAFVPPPTGNRDAKLRALMIDSWFDPYVGVIVLLRIKEGVIRKKIDIAHGDKCHLWKSIVLVFLLLKCRIVMLCLLVKLDI